MGNRGSAGCRVTTVSEQGNPSRRSGQVTGSLAVEAGPRVPVEKAEVSRVVAEC